jgi:hypothetical protein
MVNKFLDNDQALCIKISFRRLTGRNTKVFEALLFEHHHIPKGGEMRKVLKSLALKYRGKALFLTRLGERY